MVVSRVVGVLAHLVHMELVHGKILEVGGPPYLGLSYMKL